MFKTACEYKCEPASVYVCWSMSQEPLKTNVFCWDNLLASCCKLEVLFTSAHNQKYIFFLWPMVFFLSFPTIIFEWVMQV